MYDAEADQYYCLTGEVLRLRNSKTARRGSAVSVPSCDQTDRTRPLGGHQLLIDEDSIAIRDGVFGFVVQ